MERKKPTIIKTLRESTQVLCTGDWSSDSKYSAIQNHYWKDPYFEILNTTTTIGNNSIPKRTSLICRGYYVRFCICDYYLTSIIQDLNGSPFQIVSLGCGMDSTFFRIFTKFKIQNECQFYEVDFPSVIQRKKDVIKNQPNLQKLADNNLTLISTDLRNISKFDESFKNIINFDFKKPTIFYSECVVNYLKSSENDGILNWITTNIPNCIWLAYEQCFPSDSFGQIMISHFDKNGCPLLSIQKFDDMNNQELQLQNAGFKQCHVLNVWDTFLQIANYDEEFTNENNTKYKLQFDEYEGFVATCLHYSIRIGSNINYNNKYNFINSIQKNNINNSTQVCRPTVQVLKNLKVGLWESPLTGHSSIYLNPYNILMIGGTNIQYGRLPYTTLFKYSSINNNNTTNLFPNFIVLTKSKSSNFERLHSTSTYVPYNNSIYIFGGRKSPSIPCNNELICMKLHGLEILYNIIQNCVNQPCPRWRHTMEYFTNGNNENQSHYLFLFGGKTINKKVLGDCWIFNILSCEWKMIEPTTTQPPHEQHVVFPSNRHSHSMCHDSKRHCIYIVGGISSNDISLCKDTLWEYNYKNQIWTHWEQQQQNELLLLATQKFGHVTLIYEDNLIILGGYGNSTCMIYQHFVAIINLNTKMETYYKLEFEPNIESTLFLPFGFSAAILIHQGNKNVEKIDDDDDDDYILVFGGGGNCFSFGTHMNKLILQIKLPIS